MSVSILRTHLTFVTAAVHGYSSVEKSNKLKPVRHNEVPQLLVTTGPIACLESLNESALGSSPLHSWPVKL
ncbi:hypothetical protein CgunFtcFv8_009372 [Champsocephalus gunnari]|uniref:Uncharacterized protein n=1 Tax=Champsocephalus gunnari TaxID=52237 RepID=A0AAN8GYY7_CHAGU|nr:hypothetical protein CgunFtcFv8_009372 [Champsocephalus gunnari]